MLLQELMVKISLQLDDLQKGSIKAKEEANKLEATFKGLKGALVSLGVFSFLKSSALEYAEAQRNSVLLGYRLRALGGDVQANKKAMEEYANAMAKASGIQDEELTAGMTDLLDKTKDMTVSMSLLQDAMDLSVAKNMSVAQASELVGRAYAGDQRALMELGRMFGVSRDKATDFTTVMGAMRKQIQGAATDSNDLTQKFGQMKQSFGDFQEETGKLFTFGGTWSGFVTGILDAATKGLKIINEFQEGLKASWKNIRNIWKNGWKETHAESEKIFKNFIDNTVDILKSGEEKKTVIARVHTGKRHEENQEQLDKEAKSIREKAEKIAEEQAKMMAQPYEDAFSSISDGFESMFSAIAEEGATAEKVFVALARGMAKSLLGAIATSIDAQIAEATVGYFRNMILGGPLVGAAVSAYSLPMLAAMATASGTIRGLAGSLAEGGVITRPGLYAMADSKTGEPEMAVPLSKIGDVFRQYRSVIERGAPAGGGGTTVVIQRVFDQRGAVVASNDFDKGKAARNIGNMLAQRGIINRRGA